MIRFETAGESHGEALIALISGLPAGLPVDFDFINRELWRRQQGYGRGGRMKIETDKVHVLSGVRHGKTIGSPIAIQIANHDWKNWEEKLPVEVGVSRPGALYGFVLFGVAGLDGQNLFPVLPVVVGEGHGDGRADGVAVADAGEDVGGVLFDAHAATAAVALLAAPELVVEEGLVNGDARG